MLSRLAKVSENAGMLLAFVALLLPAGCSHQDFERPLMGAITDLVDSGKPYVEPEDTDVALREKRLTEAVAKWQQQFKGGEEDYRIGPDDVLSIGIFALVEPDKKTDLKRTVMKNGGINLPWVGSVQVCDLSIEEARQQVISAYKGKYLKNPEVTLTVAEYRSAMVVVTGAVKDPGVYYMRKNRTSVLEILSEAQGLSDDAGDELVVIRSGASGDEDSGSSSEMITVDLVKLINDGDLRMNVTLERGDIVSVPTLEETHYYMLGYVNGPGAFRLKRGEKLGVLQAVARAGGLNAMARAENSFLLRDTDGERKVINIDLTKIIRGVRPNVYLKPGDTFVVGSSTFVKLKEFVHPGVNAGVNAVPAQP